jgi:hypothetical protein
MKIKPRTILIALTSMLAVTAALIWMTREPGPASGRPKLFTSLKYPPETPEEQAMWDWWHRMEKQDERFQWKTPIEFYGRVLDQHDQPVPEAKVTLGWTASGGSKSGSVRSDANGYFEFTGERGKYLDVDVSKPGYVGGKQARKGFEYAAFFEFDFHVPDAMRPVIFRLWKLGDSEPMYLWNMCADVGIDSRPIWISARTGKAGTAGDLSISVWRSIEEAKSQTEYDFRITLRAAPGGGIVQTKDDLMYLAPETGWASEIVISRHVGPPWYGSVEEPRIYLRTPDGKFAAMKIEVAQFTAPGAGIQTTGYMNPSGSRNLEFDQKKQLKP